MQTPISTPSPRLDGKVAIVTGASRGIGRAIAHCFAAHGASVVLASRKLEGLETVAREIIAAGGQATAIACHTGKQGDVGALVAGAIERHGKVDVLVNNAATNPYFGPLLECPETAWDKTFEVNTKGYFFATREVARHLIARGSGGSIVNVASIVGMGAALMQGVYGMTKASVISMTQTLAVELGGTAVRINAIAPGLIETHFAGALLASQELVARMQQQTPARRVGHPDDIAGLALFLASDASAFVTGQTFVADGGMTLATSGL